MLRHGAQSSCARQVPLLRLARRAGAAAVDAPSARMFGPRGDGLGACPPWRPVFQGLSTRHASPRQAPFCGRTRRIGRRVVTSAPMCRSAELPHRVNVMGCLALRVGPLMHDGLRVHCGVQSPARCLHEGQQVLACRGSIRPDDRAPRARLCRSCGEAAGRRVSRPRIGRMRARVATAVVRGEADESRWGRAIDRAWLVRAGTEGVSRTSGRSGKAYPVAWHARRAAAGSPAGRYNPSRARYTEGLNQTNAPAADRGAAGWNRLA